MSSGKAIAQMEGTLCDVDNRCWHEPIYGVADAGRRIRASNQ